MVTAGIVCSLVGAHAGGPRSNRGAKPVPCLNKCKDAHPFIKSSPMHSTLHSILLAPNIADKTVTAKNRQRLAQFRGITRGARFARHASAKRESSTRISHSARQRNNVQSISKWRRYLGRLWGRRASGRGAGSEEPY